MVFWQKYKLRLFVPAMLIATDIVRIGELGDQWEVLIRESFMASRQNAEETYKLCPNAIR